MSEEVKRAQALIKAVHEDGVATINDRDYVFTKTTHKVRLKIFAYLTSIKEQLKTGDFGFMGSKEWEDIEATMSRVITFDDMQLSKLPDHWDNYSEDYLQLMPLAMQVITFPLVSANRTS